MTRGIYILGNDRVTDHCLAFLKSLRLYDSETPIVLIPYDDRYQDLFAQISEPFKIELYPDLELIDRISHRLHSIFGTEFFARSNQFRKQACWYGPFDEFLYIDTDIIVFEKIIDLLDHLKNFDFLTCDYQFKGGITNVFTPKILEDGIFTEDRIQEIFNCGFWASKKNLIPEEDLYTIFAECAAHPDYFDFSQKASDQPIINYMILKTLDRRINVTRYLPQEPGSWGGSRHFREKHLDDRRWVLYDQGKPLRYIHWAGIELKPGAPYYDLWQHYRYLDEVPPTAPAPDLWSQGTQQLKKWLGRS